MYVKYADKPKNRGYKLVIYRRFYVARVMYSNLS